MLGIECTATILYVYKIKFNLQHKKKKLYTLQNYLNSF